MIIRLLSGIVFIIAVIYIVINIAVVGVMSHLAEKSNMTLEEFDHRYVRWFLLSKSMKDVDDAVQEKIRNGEVKVHKNIYY